MFILFYPQVLGKTGEVGDRTIMILSGRADGRPTLQIIKHEKVGDRTISDFREGKELVDKITYVE